MSTSEPSPSLTLQLQIAAQVKRKARWITIGTSALAVTVVLGWFLQPKARELWHAAQAKELAAQAEALMAAGQPEQAFDFYTQALRKNPGDPSFIRMMARCLDELPGGEINALRHWNFLHRMSHATWEDTVAMGQAALRCNLLSRARQIEATLPKESHGERQTREFQAAILALTGKLNESRQLLRATWFEHRENPECRVKLASLEALSKDKAIQASAVTDLWQAARTEGKLSAIAMLALAECHTLDAQALAELATLAAKSPALRDKHRFRIFHHCVRQSPELLSKIVPIAREVAVRGTAGARDQFYQWASAQNQTDMVLQELPEPVALKSRGLFLARVDALMRKSRWEELKRLLGNRQLPVSKVDVELIRAHLARRQGMGDAMHSHLHGAVLYASGSSSPLELAQVGAGAQNLGHTDIALTAYGELAKRQTLARLQTLGRIYELNEQRRDVAGMLKTASALVALEPSLLSYAVKQDYLRLISGIEVDEAMNNLLFAGEKHVEDLKQPLAPLSKALAAFRSGDCDVMTRSLDSASRQASELEPGPQAIFAGLLWQAGKRADAIAMAKHISRAGILKEEQSFLDLVGVR